MTTFMPPPPAATFLAFHPQDNNVIAIGMDDSSIQIYNVRVDEVGHLKESTLMLRTSQEKVLKFDLFIQICRLKANSEGIKRELQALHFQTC